MSRPLLRFDSPWLVALLLAGLSLIASSPLLSDSWFISHEALAPIERVIAYAEEIRHGDFYPRWLSVTYNGKGSPFFNFYSPAFYQIAAWLHVAGLPLLLSIKIPSLILFFGGAWGMYLWTREHFTNTGGLIAAIIYLFTPYHFVDIYVRGAFAEFAALAILPYLFWSIDQTLKSDKNLRDVVLLALCSALLLLTHNLSTIMIFPFALLYTLFRFYQSGSDRLRLLAVAAGPIIGAGLSAFYWLPILFERKALYNFSGALTTGYFSYEYHFVYPGQWFSSFWGFGESLIGPEDGMSFQIGLLLSGSLLLSLLALFKLQRTQRQFLLLSLTLGCLALLLTTAATAFIYQLLPPLAYIQFPWRFLGPATLLLAASCGALGPAFQAQRFYPLLIIVLIGLAIFLSAGQRTVQQSITENFDELEPAAISEQLFGPMCSGDEYLPRWATAEAFDSQTDGKPQTSSGSISQLLVQGKKMRFTVSGSEKQATVTVPWFYFPGWQASIDQNSTPVTPSPLGFLELLVPPGAHNIELSFDSTAPRIAGWLVSASTLAGLGAAIFYRQRMHRLTNNPGPNNEPA